MTAIQRNKNTHYCCCYCCYHRLYCTLTLLYF